MSSLLPAGLPSAPASTNSVPFPQQQPQYAQQQPQYAQQQQPQYAQQQQQYQPQPQMSMTFDPKNAKNLARGPDGKRKWNHGLCDCCGDCGTWCVVSMFGGWR